MSDGDIIARLYEVCHWHETAVLDSLMERAGYKGCSECDGKGYLLGQTYGEVDIPDGWTPVQRCDTCEKYLNDEEAVRTAAQDHTWDPNNPVTWAMLCADDLPTGYAINWREEA